MKNIQPRVLSGKVSVLLDTLRLGASLVVLYRHAVVMWFPNLAHNPSLPGDAAHAAVIVFFVLSGYVIAHTTTGNNRGALHYAQARLSRLYSVVLPALVLTALIAVVVARMAPALSAEYTRGLSWPRYLLTGGFLNEIWFTSTAPPINRPLWSLSFEFWYYAIFGLWFYRRAGIKGLLLPLAACVVAGPKILLMMPLWVAGVVAYRLPRPRLQASTAWLLVAGSLLAAGIMVATLPPAPFSIGYAPLYFAGQFLTDWGTGIFMAIALWILPTGSSPNKSAGWMGTFRQIADLTFPIYVVHHPLLILWRALVKQRMYDVGQLAAALAAVLLVSVLIGLVLEKQRPAWVKFFKWLLNLTHNAAKPTSYYSKPG